MQPTINPYLLLADNMKIGLDAIVATSPTSTTDIEKQVYLFVKPLFYGATTSLALEMELKSVISNSINTYVNAGNANMYSPAQLAFINLMTGPSFVNGLTVDTLSERITDIEDNISKSGLSVEEQQPLYMATAVGKQTYAYFLSIIVTPPTPNPWGPYLSTAIVSPLTNLPFWVAASMEATLIGARTTFKGMIAPTTDIVGVEIISALTAALTIICGKIMLKWVPRIQVQPLMLNKETIASLNAGNSFEKDIRTPGPGMPPRGSLIDCPEKSFLVCAPSQLCATNFCHSVNMLCTGTLSGCPVCTGNAC